MHDGALVHGGIAGEVRQALTNLDVLLESQGASLADVVKTTVFLRHMSDYPAMNAAYLEAFGDHRPARTAVAVSDLPLRALVEIEAWAYSPR